MKPIQSFLLNSCHKFIYCALLCLVIFYCIKANADVLDQWSAKSITTANLTGVAYGNGIFAAVGNNEIWTSADGLKWTKAPAFNVTIQWSEITFAEGVFVAVGKITTSGFNPGIIATSANGKNWQTTQSGNASNIQSHVSFVNNEFLAYGATTVGQYELYSASPDGYNWTVGGGLIGFGSIAGITYVNGDFLAEFNDQFNGGRIFYNPTLANIGSYGGNILPYAWASSASTLFGIATGSTQEGNETTVAVGGNGLIEMSYTQTQNVITAISASVVTPHFDMGITNWTSEVSGTANTLEYVTYAGGLFITVGADGTILTSPDGITWTTRNSDTLNLLKGVAYDGAYTYVAVGNNGTVTVSYAPPDTALPTVKITSPKANLKTLSSSFTLTGTASDNVAVANVYYSLNGSDWTLASTGNNWATWTAADVTLTPGINTLEAEAVDASGNVVTSKPISFDYVAYAPLALAVNGNGKVSPADNGKLLQIGKTYSLKATAAKGWQFVNWTGTATITTPTLKFTMASGITFTANFVPKP